MRSSRSLRSSLLGETLKARSWVYGEPLRRMPASLARSIRFRPATGSPNIPHALRNHSLYASAEGQRVFKLSGQFSSHEGRSEARIEALLVSSGRRAHQTWRKLRGGRALAAPRSRIDSAPTVSIGSQSSINTLGRFPTPTPQKAECEGPGGPSPSLRSMSCCTNSRALRAPSRRSPSPRRRFGRPFPEA